MKKPLLKISVVCSDNVRPCVDIIRYEDCMADIDKAYKSPEMHDEDCVVCMGEPWLEEYAMEGYGKTVFYEVRTVLLDIATIEEVKNAIIKSILMLSEKTAKAKEIEINDEFIKACLE